MAADTAAEETADADTADDLDDGSDDSDDDGAAAVGVAGPPGPRSRPGRRRRPTRPTTTPSPTPTTSRRTTPRSPTTTTTPSPPRAAVGAVGAVAAAAPATTRPTPTDDDPPGTVTRIRAPREPRRDGGDSGDGDGVQSVRGSTRLEAKRQRRRDGRDAGRRRQPILSEAEFLARRESVERTMVVRERGSRIEIGVLEDDVLVEHFVTGRDGGSLVGNVYLGRVQNVLPSMEAAFVDIGRGRNAVLYAGEVDWDAAGLGGKARRIEQALSTRRQRARAGHQGPDRAQGRPADHPDQPGGPVPGLRARPAARPGSAASCPTSSAGGSRTCCATSSPARPA